jgi:hypothetical protein
MTEGLRPLEAVLLGRTVPREHVLALVLAGRLPEPVDGLVPPDYLDALDPDPVPELPAGEWRDHVEREVSRYRDGRRRLLDALGDEGARRREQQLMRIASAAWGTALALVMEGRTEEPRVWFDRAGTLYRRSLADAEPGSWGRSVACLKCRLLGADPAGAAREARWTLELGARAAESATARYAATLALLVLDRDAEAMPLAQGLLEEESFPPATARALLALATGDADAYAASVAEVLVTFETRDRFLEDVPVADTVLTLQELARPRAATARLASPRLPPELSSSAAAG